MVISVELGALFLGIIGICVAYVHLAIDRAIIKAQRDRERQERKEMTGIIEKLATIAERVTSTNDRIDGVDERLDRAGINHKHLKRGGNTDRDRDK